MLDYKGGTRTIDNTTCMNKTSSVGKIERLVGFRYIFTKQSNFYPNNV